MGRDCLHKFAAKGAGLGRNTPWVMAHGSFWPMPWPDNLYMQREQGTGAARHFRFSCLGFKLSETLPFFDFLG
ncbi:hypothetical protein L1987_85916 [Smallanthus sonchifolius]|uniref:Uncharacterized protein n=1 Tax=Smallanthus sonchifolius TaxID=185202 RepID=A0ACB8Y223_9ASTR|nr:hypothetical protein L1987_85916 [Smallanthus sonchifolius]